MTVSLRQDQMARLAFYIANRKCMDLSDPGTGKTPPVCVNQFRRHIDDQLGTIWVMPKSLMAKNQDEIVRFTPFTDEDVAIIDGTAAKRRKLLRQEKRVTIMGPDAFKLHINELPSAARAIDVDEFHMCFAAKAYEDYGFGNYSMSKRAQSFLSYAPRAVEMVLMSGTLVNGRLDSAFSAIHAIEPGYYPMGLRDFMGHHAIYDLMGDFDRWTNHDRLAKIFARHGVRFTFEQIFGHQEVVRELRWVEMTPPQRELYDTFKEQAYLELEDFLVNGTLPGVATMRARQIMEHPNAFPDLRDTKRNTFIDILGGELPAKTQVLGEEIHNAKETGKPLIVFSALIPQLKSLLDQYGGWELHGEVSAEDRRDRDRCFREHGGLMIASPAVASVGYNWQMAGGKEVETVVNTSLSYYDTHFIQGYRRAVRGVRKKPLRVLTLAYKDSVDEKIMQILRRKSLDAHKVDPTQELICFNDHENPLRV